MSNQKVTPDGEMIAIGGGDKAPIKHAVIAASSSGNNTLVAAVSGKKIRVISYAFVSAGTVNVRFESGAGVTALTGVMPFVANGGISCAENLHGWFETASGALLNMELSDAISVAGHLSYIEIKV